MSSSHGNRSRSDRRTSHVALESSCHENLAQSLNSTFDDPQSGSHGNQQAFSDRPLTSGLQSVSGGEGESVEDGGGEGVRGEGAASQQSELV